MMNTGSCYLEYSDLGPEEIRLLTIQPSDEFKEPLACSLHNSALEDAGYEALSYVWGDGPAASTPIHVNEQPCAVKPNLLAALRRLRRADRPRVMWVDALCINQGDDTEKSVQVARMGRIFSRAGAVVCWLGDETETSNLGMQLVESLAAAYGETLSPAARDAAAAAPARLESLVSQLTGPEQRRSWRALDRLIRRDYWKRAWVVQEIILARQAILCCGPRCADWGRFCAVVDLFPTTRPASSVAGDSWRDMLRAIAAMRRASVLVPRNAGPGRPVHSLADTALLDILVRYRTREASDDRDKVFGLLGLTDHRGLRIDYSQRTSEVYRNIVTYLVMRDGNLDVLSAVCHLPSYVWRLLGKWSASDTVDRKMEDNNVRGHIRRTKAYLSGLTLDRFTQILLKQMMDLKNSQDESGFQSSFDILSKTQSELIHRALPEGATAADHLPSWAPDWSKQFYKVAPEVLYLFLSNRRGCPYDACSGSKARAIFNGGPPYTLDLAGVKVDSIKAVFPVLPFGETIRTGTELAAYMMSRWEFWKKEAFQLGQYGSDSDERTAFARTALSGSVQEQDANRPPTGIGPDGWEIWSRKIFDGEQMKAFFASSRNECIAFAGRCHLFPYFVTELGYMGYGPLGLREGDAVAVFAGGKVPFILRPRKNGSSHILLGECYVEGIMHGETFQPVLSEHSEAETITLL